MIRMAKRNKLILRLVGITLLILMIVPWGFSYIFSMVNHNSFYDYGYLWWYYPYLGIAIAVLMVILIFYMVSSRARGY